MGKREALLAQLAEFVLSHGLAAATLRRMADAAGQSDRMLLYYFKDKDEILAAVLGHLGAEFAQALAANQQAAKQRKDILHARLDAVVLGDALWPYLRLHLELTAGAAGMPQNTSGQVAHHVISEQAEKFGQTFHAWIEAQLITPHPDLRRTEATEIMIGLQGVVMLKAMGLQGLVEELL